MTISHIFGQTFRIYKYNFLRLLAIVIAVQAPIALLTTFSTGLTHLVAFSTSAGERCDNDFQWAVFSGMMVARFAATFLGILAFNLCIAGLASSVSDFYLGRKTGVLQSYHCVLKNFGRILLVSLLVQLVVTLGAVLLIVPGIIFGLWYVVIAPVIVIENLGPVKGMRRSKSLASGNLLKIFFVILITSAISLFVSFLFRRGGGFMASLICYESYMAEILVNKAFVLAGTILVMPITAVAAILLYYDLRARMSLVPPENSIRDKI